VIGIRKTFLVVGATLIAALASANPFLSALQQAGSSEVQPGAQATEGLGQARNLFQENRGQWDARALFHTYGPGYSYWATRTGATLDYFTIREVDGEDRRVGHVVQMRIDGATGQGARGKGLNASPLRIDYTGPHKGRNTRGVRGFAEAWTDEVLPGVDMRHYKQSGVPRYDIVAAPFVKAEQITLVFDGAKGVEVDSNGDLLIHTSIGTARQKNLETYQIVGNQRRVVESQFIPLGKNRVGFKFGRYDRSKPLVIDPLVYGTYIGGDGAPNGAYDETNASATNNAGQLFVTGSTFATDFPVTVGPYSVNLKESLDGFVVALSADVYAPLYVAYYAGVAIDVPKAIAVDQYGSVWIAGETTSGTFAKDLRQKIEPISPDEVPDAGTFRLTWNGASATPTPFNATAAQVLASLDEISTPGTFTTIGGALPLNRVFITATGPDLNPVVIEQQVHPYTLAVEPDLGGASLTLSWVPPDPDAGEFGYRPQGGTFRISVNGTLTAPIDFDATGADIVAALTAAPISLPVGEVTLASGPASLPAGTISIALTGGAATRVYDIVTTTLTAFFYVTEFNQRLFMQRLASDPATVLNPFQNETIHLTGNDDSADQIFGGFAIRPVATPSSTVDLVLSGTALGAVPDITALPPDDVDNFGFLSRYRYNQGGGTFTVQSGLGRYIAEGLPTAVKGLAVDGAGSAYVTGYVQNTNNAVLSPTSPLFVVTNGIYTGGNLLRRTDAFARKYDSAGNLQVSTLIGGSGDDEGSQIAIDSLGNIYVTGISRSFNFPRTVGSFGQVFTLSDNVFVTKLSPTANQVLYSTNLRTTGPVRPLALKVDSRGNAYVGGIVGYIRPPLPGTTTPGAIVLTPIAPNVPGQEPALDTTYENGNLQWPRTLPALVSTTEGFLTVLNSTATGLLLSTYVGGPVNEQVNHIHLDSTNSAYLTGITTSGGIFVPISGVVDSFFIAPGNTGLPGGFPGLPGAFLAGLPFKIVPDIFADGYLLKIRVGLPILDGIVLNPDQVAGGLGSTSTGTVFLREVAPAGGTQVTIRVLNPQVARLSSSGATSIRVTVPAGANFADFTIFTRAVNEPSFSDIRAEYDGDLVVARLNVRPWLDAFTISTEEIPGGNSLQGSVRLFQPAPAGGVQVQLSSGRPDFVEFPVNPVTIPAGQQTVTFDIDTNGVDAPTDVNVQASVEGVGLTQRLRLVPVSVVNVTFDPPTVNGGETATGTILLDGEAAEGARVNLAITGHPGVVEPNPIKLNKGDRTATFIVKTTASPNITTNSTITATLNGSSASGVLQISGTDITSVSLNATSVLGGAVVQGTITLSRPASASGFVIPLNNTNVGAGSVSPMTVTIAPGSNIGTFTVQTNGVSTTQNMTIRANKTGYNAAEATLQVRALAFDLALTPSRVPGGAASTGRITLRNGEVAPAGGLRFTLTSSDPTVASLPTSLTIPAGATTATFNISTSLVSIDRLIRITAASPSGVSDTRNLIVDAPRMTALSVSPNNLLGGQTANGTITLSSPAPAGGLQIRLTSNVSAVVVPATVTVPGGATSVNFVVGTAPVSGRVTATLTARRDDDVRTTTVTVNVTTVSSITFSPSTVIGGNTATGTITLEQVAPTGGLLINLYVDQSAFVTFPRRVTVPAGSRTVNFSVPTTVVTRDVAVRFTAEVNASGATTTGTLFISRTANR